MKKNKIILFLILSVILVSTSAFFKLNQFRTTGNVLLMAGTIATYFFLFLLIKDYIRLKKRKNV
ncbi:MAG: hypothetical protein LBF04_07080 [Prevotellaceae bacterium]|nr:hypothetical protein [Prevotellaceae bacterium]